MNTVTTVGIAGVRRGDYIAISAHYFYGAATSGLARSSGMAREEMKRVTHAAASVLTVRAMHRWRAVEWLHARVEDARWWLGDRLPRIVIRD